jgi:UDP-glucose 4-epimerase
MPAKKILVVGGAGFIGSHVNKMLNASGYETIIFDNLSRGDSRAVINGSFVKGDISSLTDLTSLFDSHNFDAVMHFAAFTDVGESVYSPEIYYANNVAATLQLLSLMVKHRVNNFIFSSSAAVYGIPKEPYIVETSVCQPINPYGRTKRMVEEILQDFESAHGLQYCALRYFNAAGGDPDGEIKNYKKKENNLIPLALRSLLDPNGQITVFGTDYPTDDGTCIRDYIHVNDLASAHILAMEALLEGAPSDIYNLGNGNGFSVKEVLTSVENVTGKSLNIKIGDRRPGDPAILLANSEKAHQKLQWHPKYTLIEEMIAHAWQAIAEGAIK